MTCHNIGLYPIFTSGFGTSSVSSRNLVPNPPQNNTTFMFYLPSSRLDEFNFNRPSLFVFPQQPVFAKQTCSRIDHVERQICSFSNIQQRATTIRQVQHP